MIISERQINQLIIIAHAYVATAMEAKERTKFRMHK